ncbi:protein of unknown function [Cupriavidus taiwanensis]|nr:protein of unknown function [Cupriavidus taiwanensis]
MVENYQKVLMLTISTDLLSAVSGRVYYSGQFGFNTVLTLLAFGTFPRRILPGPGPNRPAAILNFHRDST